ncbi:MAG: orotidine-5'-phosphate decarboxylase [Actinomycetes bacterium]
MSDDIGSAAPFGDVLSASVKDRRSQILLGLDPEPSTLWPDALEAGNGLADGSLPRERAAAAVAAHCSLVLAATAEFCVGVKLQLASFERLGVEGRAALDFVVAAAKAHSLIVLADGKRGDIGISASSYAASLLGRTETPWGDVDGLGVDAVTVNPLLGAETVVPFIDEARKSGAGVFVLARTSNPGAVDVQDREIVDGGTVSDVLAGMVNALGTTGSSGIADVGAVVGATVPGHLAHLRTLMPSAPILLTGVGAQGGRVEDLAPAFAPGPAGGLITVSRGIVGAGTAAGTAPAAAAAAAAEEFRALAWSISAAG